MQNRVVVSIAYAIAAIALISIPQPVLAQAEPAVWSSYTCIRIEPGKGAEFEKLILDNYPQMIRVLMEEKRLVWWGFHRGVTPAGEDPRCNYIISSVSLGAPAAPLTRAEIEQHMKKAGLTMTYGQFQAKRNAIAKTVTTGTSRQFAMVGRIEKGDYYALNYMKSMPGKTADYAKFELEVWRPMVAEEIARGGLWKGWSASRLWYPWGESTEFDFVTLDVFRDWESVWKPQAMSESVVSKVFPGKTLAEITAPLPGLRKQVRRELFRVIEAIGSTAPGPGTD